MSESRPPIDRPGVGKPDLRTYLGRRVRVVVDRPLGSRHPRRPETVYPINYGYLPGTRSGDGAPTDAYVLGVDEPVREADGVVVAVVRREDDAEDKLVVACEGRRFTAGEIAVLVDFQERFFASRIDIEPDGQRSDPGGGPSNPIVRG